ncbi:MAG: NADP-dependent oxidoreductase [Candidatus Leucobacter sulfamidivorax]|nr:NADP-dependent oxidoreductase [Candidatus Leucobacter sulfamidivorax]
MRIIEQEALGGSEVLKEARAETPTPGGGQIRVRVAGIGVNPVDIAVREGWLPFLGEPPFVLGWDVAGVVDAVGPGVVDFAVGDRVFGMPAFPNEAGCYAEYVVGAAGEFARTPAALSDIEAAALPLVALTAWQALVEAAALRPGQRVLVHAGAGGVGHVAIQLAKALGAYTIATVSAAKADFVRGLGADEVVDYRARDYTEGLAPVDVALDTLGGEEVKRTISVVRDGGVLATLVPGTAPEVIEEAARRGIAHAEIRVRPDGEVLRSVADLVSDGRLRPHVGLILPLARAAEAHDALSAGTVVGKIVLAP